MLLNRHSKPVPGNVILDCIGNEEGEIFLICLLFSERHKRNIVKSSQELNLFFFSTYLVFTCIFQVRSEKNLMLNIYQVLYMM